MSTMSEFRSMDPVDRDGVEKFVSLPVFDELFEAIVSSPDDETGAADHARGSHIRVGRSPRSIRRRRWTYLVGAAVIVVIAVGVFVNSGVQQPRGVTITPLRTARPLTSRTLTPNKQTAGHWRLVDDLVSSSWQQNTSGPPPGNLTCPTVSACYALSGSYPSARGGAPLISESLYVSTDLGHSWSVLPMPDGFHPTTQLSCGTPSSCFVGGSIDGHAIFLSTSDGGRQWTIVPFAGPGILVRLTCIGPTVCNAIAAPIVAVPTQAGPMGLRYSNESFVRTTDGGSSWTSRPLAPDESVISLSCATDLACVAVGSQGLGAGSNSPGFVQSTGDGGAHWRAGVVPRGFDFGLVFGVACPTTQNCTAIGLRSVPNVDRCVGTPPNVQIPPGANSCSSGSTTLVGAVAVTNDGGMTWHQRTLPSDVPNPQLTSLSCPSPTVCWLGGQEAVPIVIGNVHDEGSSVLLGTTDGGSTWQRVTFTVPPGAPNYDGQSYLSMGPISCPTTSACVAIGAAAQGATSTPVYSYGSGS
jgi:photosystem II stability/assembly factor-like uncharacterized protein